MSSSRWRKIVCFDAREVLDLLRRADSRKLCQSRRAAEPQRRNLELRIRNRSKIHTNKRRGAQSSTTKI
jgi:hypothetical protein